MSTHPQLLSSIDKIRQTGRNSGGFTASNGLIVVEVQGLDYLRRCTKAWERLCSAVTEPNPFYEPWMLLRALREFGSADLRFVFVYQGEEACGFFPLVLRLPSKTIPATTLSLWQHKYCFLCTPLVRANLERPVLAALLEWLPREVPASGLMKFNHVSADGPFLKALKAELQQKEWLNTTVGSFQRAEMQCGSDSDTYLELSISNGRRKELRRLRNRLQELGTVRFEELQQLKDRDRWIEDFLKLEASGWKGTSGGAMALEEGSRRFFRSVVEEAFERKRLMMLGLFLNDEPIAVKVNLLAAPGAFSFKIAYDERFSRYSAGVQLELENIRRAHERGLRWMDSCAAPNHPMIDRLWGQRRTIQTVVISPGKPSERKLTQRIAFSLVRSSQWLKRTLT